MLCINTFGRVRYFPDQAKKKIQNGRTSTLNIEIIIIYFKILIYKQQPVLRTQPCTQFLQWFKTFGLVLWLILDLYENEICSN